MLTLGYFRRTLFMTPVAFALVLPAQTRRPAETISPAVQRLYAEAHEAQAKGDVQTAIALYNEIIRLAPRLAPAYNNLGMLYFNSSDYEHAAEALRKALTLDPHMATAQVLLGLSDYRMSHLAEAKVELTKALAADPTNNDAELALARIEIATGAPNDGTAHLRSYLQRNPRDQQAWYLLGKTYLQLSQESLAKIDAIDPDSATAHVITGEIDESMRNYDGALAEYNKAIVKDPNLAGTHYHMGNAFWLEQKYDSAAEQFRAELRIDPGNCIAQWKLGDSLLGANQPPTDALVPLNAAIAACPNLMQAHVDRANALLKLNDPQRALADLLPAEQATPGEPSIHFLLARAYKELGQSEQSRTELERFAQLQREASESTAAQAKDVLSVKEGAH